MIAVSVALNVVSTALIVAVNSVSKKAMIAASRT